VAEIYPALDAQTSATILPSTLAVVEIAVAGERGGGVDDDDEEEDDPSAMQYDEDGEVMAARRRRQRQRDEYAAQALSMLLKCWPDKKGEASDGGAGEIIWPVLAAESAAAAGELALGEKYVSLLSAAMSRPAVNVRCTALAALEEWTERASTAVLASQMAAILPCVQTGAPVTHSLHLTWWLTRAASPGLGDLKAAEVRRLSISATSKLLKVVEAEPAVRLSAEGALYQAARRSAPRVS